MANRSIGSVRGTVVFVLVVAVIGAPVLAQDEDESTQEDQEGVEEEQAVEQFLQQFSLKRRPARKPINVRVSTVSTDQARYSRCRGAIIQGGRRQPEWRSVRNASEVRTPLAAESAA